MKRDIDEARKICAAVLKEFFPEAGLLADMLDANGGYRGFWQTPDGVVLKTESDNIFDRQDFTCIYELRYAQPKYGWPMAS
jgi:hypothetical protein